MRLSNTYKIILGVCIIISLFIIMIGFLNIIPRNATESSNSPVFPQQQVKKILLKTKDLQVLSIVSPVSIQFESPINIQSISYTLEPKVDVFVELDSTQTILTFKPTEFWEPNTTYTLLIKGVFNKTGEQLNTYKANFKAINTSDEEPGNHAEVDNNP